MCSSDLGCAPRKARDTDPVFVTKDGTLERFKRVSRPSFSHKISHERIRDIIRLRLSPMTVETEIVLLRLQDIADIDFDAEIEGRRPLTLEKIIRINAAIEKVLSEA